jgi:hypothetical protein
VSNAAVAAGAALAALALTACGGSDDEAERPDRPPLRYASAGDAAVRYIRRVGDGDPGFALAIYDPAVVRDLGLTRLGRAIVVSRGRLGGVTPTIRRTRPVTDARPGTVLVRVDVRQGEAARVDGLTFIARRDGRRWRLAYDSYTRDALELHARLRGEERPYRYGRELEEAGARAVGLRGEEFGS